MTSLRGWCKMTRVSHEVEKIFLIFSGFADHHGLKLLQLAHSLVEFGDRVSWLGKDVDVAVTDLSHSIGHGRDKIFQHLIASAISRLDEFHETASLEREDNHLFLGLC